MNSLQYIENSPNQDNEFGNNSNIGISNVNSFNLSSRTNEEIMSDDLLSTHPFIGSNAFIDDISYLKKTQEPLFKQNKIGTQLTTKLFIINSKDRNPYYESFMSFSVKFNPSSDIFENQPIYYNNPTIPQTSRERELGIRGPINNSGWKDSMGNFYPAFNSSLPTGDIIAFDSIKISGTNIAYIPYKLKNVVSIKIDKLILPNSLSQDPVNPDGISVNPGYWYFAMSNIDNNYELTSTEICNVNDILIPQNDSSIQKNIWVPISEVKNTYNPPRNSFNVIKFSFISPNLMLNQFVSNLPKFIEDPNINIDDLNINENQEYFVLFLEKLWLKDVISIKKIEFSSPYIILHTTLFSQGRYTGRWREFTQVLCNNLLDNLDLDDNLEESKKILITDFILSFSNKNHSIFFTAMETNSDIKFEFRRKISELSSHFGSLGMTNHDYLKDLENLSSTMIPFGNRIIFVGPIYNNNKKSADINLNNFLENRFIGNEKIEIPIHLLGWDIILNTFLDSPILSALQLAFPNGINFKRYKSPDWVGSGPYALNLSMQILFSLKIDMLTPILQHIDN